MNNCTITSIELDYYDAVQIINDYLINIGITTKNKKRKLISSYIQRDYLNMYDLTDNEIISLFSLTLK